MKLIQNEEFNWVCPDRKCHTIAKPIVAGSFTESNKYVLVFECIDCGKTLEIEMKGVIEE